MVMFLRLIIQQMHIWQSLMIELGVYITTLPVLIATCGMVCVIIELRLCALVKETEVLAHFPYHLGDM